MAKVNYDYTSRHWSIKKERDPNEKLPPFFAETQVKVNGKNEVWPLYIPFDATDKTQGVVWLSDTLTDESAGAGMTAMTPKGVKDNTLVATKNSITGQKISTENIVFNGDIEFGGTVTGITSPDSPGGNIKNLVVKIANKNVLPTDEINYILGSGSIKNDVVTVPIGMLPLNMIPSLTEDKLPNNISGSKIANGTITSDKISSINGNKIEDGTISGDKFSIIDGSKIKDGTITNDKISSIHGSKIENGTIDNEKISTINGSKIENGTINGEKISSISGSKIEIGTITEDKLSEDAKNALFSQKQITLALGGDLKSDSVALLFGQSNTISATVDNIKDEYIKNLFKNS